MRRAAAWVTALLAALALAPPAQAADAQASLTDIEDEVMCTICGTTLALSSAPQAERQRALINELIAEGKDKEEIKAVLVDEYGPEVLAVPSSEGFDLAAWVVPIAAISLGLLLIALAARRWRRDREEETGEAPPGPLEDDEARRLQADLKRYDA